MALKLLPVLIIVVIAVHQSNTATVRKLQGKWEKHMKDFGLSYSSSADEDKFYANYEKNVAAIQEWNSNPKNTFKVGENQYTHLDSETYQDRVLMPKRYHTSSVASSASVAGRNRPTTTTTTTPKPVVLNSYVNWTSKFVGVKDQGTCGSCYSFAAAGVVEAAYAIKYSKTVSLSEEQIIDCTYSIAGSQNLGCFGGLSDYTLSWIKNNHPLYSTTDYPYLSASISSTRSRPIGTCHSVSSPTQTPISVASYGSAGSTENSVAAYVQNNGPVTAYIDASQFSFQAYKSGIYNEARCTQNTDHAVIIVGFGTDSSGQDYWIIRNSWAASWGMNGYMLLARNKGGLCGIVTENYYAKVN